MMLPVLHAGESSVRGYFPRGTWAPLWPALAAAAGRPREDLGLIESTGEWRTVPAPVGEPAVYARQGAPSFEPTIRRMVELGVVVPTAGGASAKGSEDRVAVP